MIQKNLIRISYMLKVKDLLKLSACAIPNYRYTQNF